MHLTWNNACTKFKIRRKTAFTTKEVGLNLCQFTRLHFSMFFYCIVDLASDLYSTVVKIIIYESPSQNKEVTYLLLLTYLINTLPFSF